MLSTLDDAATLERRARHELVLGAALCGGGLSPLVVMLVLSLGPGGEGGALRELALFGGWAGILGSLLAGVAVRRALTGRAEPSAAPVLGWSMLAGLVYPVCLFVPAAILALQNGSIGNSLWMLAIGPVLVTAFGAIFSLPAGLIFGVVFWSGIQRSRKRVVRPAHDLVAHARGSSVLMLLVAACLGAVLAANLEGPYCRELFYAVLPALGVVPPEGTDAAWTRFFVLPAPLSVALLVVSLRWILERRRIALTARAILGGTHPSWIADGAANPHAAERAEALPLRESDRSAKTRLAVRGRHDGSPYRTAESPIVAFLASP